MHVLLDEPALQGVDVSLHKFGGRQFNYGRKEIGHIHSNGILDLLFSIKMKKNLLAEGRIADHHVFANSGWTSFYIRSEQDVDKAVELLKMSLMHKELTVRSSNPQYRSQNTTPEKSQLKNG